MGNLKKIPPTTHEAAKLYHLDKENPNDTHVTISPLHPTTVSMQPTQVSTAAASAQLQSISLHLSQAQNRHNVI